MMNKNSMKSGMNAAQYGHIVKCAKDYLMREDMSLQENLAMFYMQSMEIEDEQEALKAADDVMRGVNRFETFYHEASEKPGMGISIMQKKMEKNMETNEEKFLFWYKTAAVIDLMNGQNAEGVNYDEQIKQIDSMTSVDGMIDKTQLDAAREAAGTAMKNFGLMGACMGDYLNQFEKGGGSADAVELLVNVCNKETEYRALTAMAACIQVKKGMVPQLPHDLDNETAAMIVCAKREQFKLLSNLNARKGAIARASVVAALGVLGGVMIALVSVIGGFALAGVLINDLLLWDIPALTAAALAAGVVIRQAVKEWIKICKKTVTFVSIKLCEIASAAKTLFEIVKPKVIEAAKNAIERVRSFIEKKKFAFRREAERVQRKRLVTA